jgi:predicted transglutaminase-like cysteine proteinase
LRASKLYFRHIAAGGLLLFTLSACATAPSPFDPLPLGRSVGAPTGFLQFCQRRPDQCLTSGPVEVATADRATPRADAQGAPAPLPLQPDYLPGSIATSQATGTDILQPATARPAATAPGRPAAPKSYALASQGPSGARLRFSADLQAELADVDGAINRAITPRTDIEAFGVDNYWALPLTDGPRPEGNCKHYALEKRRRLVQDGVPANALSLAIVTTPADEVHAVLVISTDQGDLVLDNRTNEIRPWRQTEYHWLVRQQPGAPLHWVEAGQAG